MSTAKGWQELTISDGLSQGMIYDLKQDRNGFIWIATKDGLNRYDGHNFKVFTHDPYNEFSISDNVCSALLIDRHGRLWVGTINKGLNLYDDRTQRFYHITISDQSLKNAINYEVRLLAEDPEGNIWVGNNAGKPFKIEIPSSFHDALPTTSDLTGQLRITAVQVDSQRTDRPNFYFGFTPGGQAITSVENGIFSFNWQKPNSFTKLNLFPEPTPTLFSLYEDLQRDFRFVGLSNQLIGWHGGKQKTIAVPSSNNEGVQIGVLEKNVLVLSNAQYLWLLSPDQLFKLDSLTTQNSFVDVPPNVFGVTKVLKDITGNIWVGTRGYGIRMFNPRVKQFHAYLPNTSLSNLYVDRQGRTYGRFQLAYGQVDKITNRLHPFLNPNLPPPDQRQRDMMQDSRGFFWVSNVNFETHANQLIKFSSNWQLLKKYPLPINVTFGFSGNQSLEDKVGNLWFGAVNGKLLRFNPQTEHFQVFTYQSLLPTISAQVETYAILPEPDGGLWLATSAGLVKAQSLSTIPIFTIYKNSRSNRQSLSNDFVMTLAHDPYLPDRYLWVGTKGGGLERLDKQTGQFKHFTEVQGLPNKVVYGILTDEFKNLWLSTNRGLAQFNPKTFLFRNYTKADGLQDDEFNTKSFFKSSTGELLFGGVNGLTIFRPSELMGTVQKSPQVAIIGLKINNKPVDVGSDDGILAEGIEFTSAIDLAYTQNLLTLEFGVLDYTNVGKNRFRYRLEGIDRNWVEGGTNRFANYAQLPDGNFMLEMMGSVDGEHWSKPLTLTIRVHPPFYRSWWAYLLYLTLLGLMIWQFHRFQMQRLLLQQQVVFEQKETNRLAELDALKTHFFTNISHEFRTPLTLILGPLSNRKRKNLGETELSMMERNGRRLLTLISQLLDLSKLEAGDLKTEVEPGNIATFFRTLASSFSSLADSRAIRFTFEQAKEIVWVSFDRDKIEKVVTNLLTNAFKFTPNGNEVWMRVSYQADGVTRHVQIQVEDTGIGIPSANLPHIFERFYQRSANTADGRGNRTYEGTGIGLALVHELVKVLKGTVTVASTEGVGTTFTVQLPLMPVTEPVVQPDLAISLTQQNPEQTSQTGLWQTEVDPDPSVVADTYLAPVAPENVLLIIDDNVDIRAYVRSIFEDDYHIIEAEDGQQGLEKATATTPNLVICDLMMPRLDGFGFCRALKTQEATSHIPVVMLTAKATLEDRIEGFELGADEYLTKPFNANELQIRVRNLLDKQERLRHYFGKTVVAVPATTPPTLSREDVFLQKARQVVEKHLGENAFGVEEFGQLMGLSSSQLLRKLKALTGLTAVEFVRQYRLERAAILLSSRSGNVSEIAWQVGFESLPYFTKIFQERYGVPPSEYVS